jgi:hypothetical protein
METRFRLSDLSTLAAWCFVSPQSSLPRANAPAPPAIRVKKSRRIILPPLGPSKDNGRLLIFAKHTEKHFSSRRWSL